MNLKVKAGIFLFGICLFGFALVFSGCKDSNEEESYCNTTNPTKEIRWLKDLVSSQTKEYAYPTTVYKCSYKGSQGFLVVSNPGNNILLSEYYNCSGVLICELGGSANLKTCDDFPESATLDGIVYNDAPEILKPF